MGKGIAVRDPNKIQEWAKKIEICRSSGKTVTEWCIENGISVKLYYYWHRKIKCISEGINSSKNEVYEIPQEYNIPMTANVAGTISIGTVKVDIYSGADVETLVSIIKAMQLC